MPREWTVRLEGGPFDGDEANSDPPLPERLWVRPCPSCGTHWYEEWTRGAEVYKKDETDDQARTAKYVYEGLGLGGPGLEEYEEVGTDGQRERELVTV